MQTLTYSTEPHFDSNDISQALVRASMLRSQMFRCVARNMLTWVADMTLSRLRIRDRRLEMSPCACA